jgi:hypothetical protein
MEEPTIYDFLSSLFKHKNLLRLLRKKQKQPERPLQTDDEVPERHFHFLLIPAGILALTAQYFLEPKNRIPLLAIFLYVNSLGLTWVSIKGWKKVNIDQRVSSGLRTDGNLLFLVISLLLQVVAFILFRENRFTLTNVFFWVLGISTMVLAFWNVTDQPHKREKAKNKPDLPFIIAGVITLLIILVFRISQIEAIPAEMYSDHAEKLLDIMNIFSGKFPIFFERNTGREPFQFYATALIVKLFNIGFTFLSLKIGTVLFGLLTLVYVYLIGMEIENKWVGLAAVIFAGIAYWPNVISRVALRYSLYPLFAAPVLFYLIKGLRTRRINDFILCALFIGLGLHGYSSFRIVPIFVTFILLLQSIGKHRGYRFSDQLSLLIVIGLISLSVFLPLFRYWFDNPQMFSYRTMTRLMPIEKPFEAPVMVVLLKNSISSLLMPFWNNGSIWVHSIPGRPALDFITGGFYFFGLIIFAWRGIKDRNTNMFVLLLSIPFLMLPSILSLAYPGENPSLNRSAGAYIPIFIIAGYGFFSFINSLRQRLPARIRTVVMIFAILISSGLAMRNNYQLVFDQYKTQFQENAWNTSEIGQVISGFLTGQKEESAAFVVPYPHWVDTRLVGFNAGIPGRDFALWQEDINPSLSIYGNLMFIYKPEDYKTKQILEDTFPGGSASIFYARITGKEFIIYTVLND